MCGDYVLFIQKQPADPDGLVVPTGHFLGSNDP